MSKRVPVLTSAEFAGGAIFLAVVDIYFFKLHSPMSPKPMG